MPSVEISVLAGNNQYLKEALESADSNGKNAYNNKLDSNELNDFMQKAYKSGKCSMTDIMTIVNQVGVDKNDNATITKMQKLEQINKLENEIRTLKTELKKREYTLDQKEYKTVSTTECFAGIGGFFAGIYAGVKTGAAISAAVSTTGIGAAATPVIMITSTLGGAVLGGYAAYKAADYAQRPFESHETTVKRKEAENYKENNVEPLKAKINGLEDILRAELSRFYE